MKLFSALKAILILSKQLRSLEQAIIARSLIQFPELRTINLSAMYARKDIISPLLREMYDQWAITNSGYGEDESQVVVDSISNWEKLNNGYK